MRSSLYLLFLGMAAVTYLTRFPPLWFGGMINFGPRLRRGLSFIPVGVFAAMTVPPVLTHHEVNGFNIYLPAAVLAILVAAISKNPLWSMLAGVATVAALRFLI
ncbi:AzlD domain-containing protein [Desulfotomaculum copahuensis]|uniref:Branched-chain amino acid ABC transporter n=1 Tax=Desulfotomaculum copahuensis TaxID=1838280 RepID=A0A1B7LFK3_9FIRM|nr:AzlD domain-containing protein [Desulfotomaculum copahuensis]OAT82924.1 hypothetical protein A6M21_08500 [Desulfotomaculum copahuensis]